MISKITALGAIIALLFAVSVLAPVNSLSMTSGGSTPLIAGQTLNVGTVKVSDDGATLTVTFTVTAADCYLIEAHLAVNASLGDIPQTKKGNPIPGQFSYQADFDPPSSDGTGGTTTWTQDIPLSAITGLDPTGGTIYIAAQADGQQFGWVQVDPDGVPKSGDEYLTYASLLSETAWGKGTDFPGNNWAMYIEYTHT